MTDCCIIGGGIIGLSIARELAGRGLAAQVLSRDDRHDTASWAAAGIFPPAPDRPTASANDALTAWSDRLHRDWARELRAETGIDTGLRACGGLHLAADPVRLAQLAASAEEWRTAGARCEMLAAAGVAACEPGLASPVARGAILGGFLLPDEMQIRTPRHLEAVERSCRQRGVAISRAEVIDVKVHGGRVAGVVVEEAGVRRMVAAAAYVLAAGAWSEALAAHLGLAIDTRPIRGQIALFDPGRPLLGHVVNRGLDYLVPREDGRLLAGSTIEDVGFTTATEEAAIERLVGMARELLGDAVTNLRPERAWAGLRPGSADGLPTIGRIPAVENAFVAAGHFRAGLHQSTGTAVMVADLIQGRPSPVAAAAFAPGRVARPGRDSVRAMLARAAQA
jgi:glycine oxidase